MAFSRDSFPRLRRLRRNPRLRQAVADVHLPPQALIFPVFVADIPAPQPIASMPDIFQWPVAQALDQIRQWSRLGLTQFLLFGVTPPDKKDPLGSWAASPDCPVNRLLAQVRSAGLDVLLYADLCLCEYTSHGHCGVIHPDGLAAAGPLVQNDPTLEILARTAQAQAQAGADVIAPSAMMDGQVGAVRSALDAAGFQDRAILAYSVKYASNFYGPFREAGQGGMQFGDRQDYQMDFRRHREWRSELQADLDQGTDMVMVKPAAACLDIIRQVRDHCDVPLAAYHVSGEYAMLHAAAQRGWLDLRAAAAETTFAIRRAGADLIITYFAPRLIDWQIAR